MLKVTPPHHPLPQGEVASLGQAEGGVLILPLREYPAKQGGGFFHFSISGGTG